METRIILYCIITLCAFTAWSCAINGVAAGSGDSSRHGTTIIVDNHDISLENYIRRLSGVRVSGSGANTVINIRGASSIELDSRPLLIIDGTRIGKDFSNIYNLLRVQDIHSISMFTTRSATQRFGTEGNSGAIEFVTHSGR